MVKRGSKIAVLAGCLSGALLPLSAPGAEIFVAPSGGDYATIQEALAAAQAGDTVTVLSGVYSEALVFPRSGAAPMDSGDYDGNGISDLAICR